MYWQN